ncbi:MAG: hypothetical protein ACRDJW_17805 [Thermomicrobiales bacterium]
MKRILVGFALMGVLAIGAPSVASAQDEIIGVPDPAECTVEPRSLESFQAVLATPAAATPSALPEMPDLPEGEPADEETEAAVLATLREAVACINGGEIDRLLALYSDSAIVTLIGAGMGEFAEEIYDDITTEEPPAEDARTEIIEVQGVVVLPDGRVAALVVGDDRADPDPASATLFIFVEQDGRWLIDAFIDTPDEGTPAP